MSFIDGTIAQTMIFANILTIPSNRTFEKSGATENERDAIVIQSDGETYPEQQLVGNVLVEEKREDRAVARRARSTYPSQAKIP